SCSCSSEGGSIDQSLTLMSELKSSAYSLGILCDFSRLKKINFSSNNNILPICQRIVFSKCLDSWSATFSFNSCIIVNKEVLVKLNCFNTDIVFPPSD